MPRNVCDSTEPCLIAHDIGLILMINWSNINGNLSQFTILKATRTPQKGDEIKCSGRVPAPPVVPICCYFIN